MMGKSGIGMAGIDGIIGAMKTASACSCCDCAKGVREADEGIAEESMGESAEDSSMPELDDGIMLELAKEARNETEEKDAVFERDAIVVGMIVCVNERVVWR